MAVPNGIELSIKPEFFAEQKALYLLHKEKADEAKKAHDNALSLLTMFGGEIPEGVERLENRGRPSKSDEEVTEEVKPQPKAAAKK